MAITILSTPQLYSPSGNPITFVLRSNNTSSIGIMGYIYEHSTGNMIGQSRVFWKPPEIGDTNSTAVLDIHTYLDPLVKYQVDNTNSLSVTFNQPFLNYKLIFVEKQISSGILVDGATASSNVYSVWDASLDRVSFNSFNHTDYIITNSVSTPKKFLTNKPDRSVVNDNSTELLYFLQDNVENLTLQVEAYNEYNNLYSYLSYTIPNTSSKMIRVNVSPRVLKSLGLNLNAPNTSYKVYLNKNIGNTTKTETRTYLYQNRCGATPVNILWVNNLGGIDSYQFTNPKGTMNITRNTIQKNIYDSNDNIYNDIENNIFNPSDEIVNINVSGTYEMFSGYVSDAETSWLTQLYRSKQVYIELSDLRLVPVLVEDTSYQIMRERNNKQGYNFFPIKLKVSEDILPL